MLYLHPTCYSFMLHVNKTTAFLGARIDIAKTRLWFFEPLVSAQLLKKRKKKKRSPFA
jgi:hypothetical protein